MQGHQGYIESSGTREPGPWLKYRDAVRAVEFCVVSELKYKTHPGSGESCCIISLKFTDPDSNLAGQKFRLTLPELDNFPDFIIERTRYDAAMERNWMVGDKCRVWWREEGGQGGTWYYGCIIAEKYQSSDFPESPWEKYHVSYEEDNTDYHCHSPWELQDPDVLLEQPSNGLESKEKILNSFNNLMLRATKDKVFLFFFR